MNDRWIAAAGVVFILVCVLVSYTADRRVRAFDRAGYQRCLQTQGDCHPGDFRR